MPRSLVIYATNHGHSAKIATRLAEVLGAAGLPAETHRVARNDGLDPAPFDAVVVMASIHASGHQEIMARWVKEHAATLNGKPTAFVSVSLSTASGIPDVLEQNRETAAGFAREAGWEPDAIELVAGCLQYREYGFLTRFLMKRIAKRQGLPLDTSQDHEYTDWDALEAFGREFAAGADRKLTA